MDPEPRPDEPKLPCVDWHGHKISRLVLGHNPIKGNSHYSQALSQEMAEHFDPALGHEVSNPVTSGLEPRDVHLLRRCEECGINTAQFGGESMHSLLRRHRAGGGRLQWIATFYDTSGDAAAELEAILSVDPAPMAVQYFGERIDRLFIEGRLDAAREQLKRLRDTGLWIGVCSHLPDVLEHVESADWDVDFFQACFYTTYSYSGGGPGSPGRIDRDHERYDDADRDRMVRFIRATPKPCIAFKVLAAGRKCSSDASVAAALRFAFEHIKPTDVVAVGMWQKYKDQVGQNAALVRRLLAARPPETPSPG